MLRRLTHLQLAVVARVPSNKDSPQKKNNIPFFLFKVFPISIQVSDRWLVPWRHGIGSAFRLYSICAKRRETATYSLRLPRLLFPVSFFFWFLAWVGRRPKSVPNAIWAPTGASQRVAFGDVCGISPPPLSFGNRSAWRPTSSLIPPVRTSFLQLRSSFSSSSSSLSRFSIADCSLRMALAVYTAQRA